MRTNLTGPRARRAALVVAPLSLLAVAAPAVALAAGAPTSHDTFTGCLDTSWIGAGNLSKVKAGVKPTSKCDRDETQISWNAQGVKGDTGPAGPQGPAGQAGAAGKDGADGADGADGKDGLSAYELAVENGFDGDVEAWLGSLQGTVVADEGPSGTPGKDGKDGKDGKAGVDGKDGVSGYHQVTVKTTVAAGQDASVTVKCERGRVLGGGSWSSFEEIDQRSSAPANTGKAWRVSMTNLGSKSYTVTAYAICAKV